MKNAEIDFKKIRREYKKLHCPSDTYNPNTIPFETCKWSVIISDRSRGKTTNLLLYGLVMNKLYGTVIQYIRTHEENIVKKNSQDLFETVVHFRYVERITDGEYDTIMYDRRRWYYAKYDENGDIEKKSATPICMMLSVDKNQTYKSVYNAPLGDFILYDEFIEKYYYPNEFVNFVDLVKTICRDRTSPVIVLCANSIDKNSPYFKELEINREITDVHMGENKIITTELGTKIYFEILEPVKGELSKVRRTVNRLYYGFKNSKLSSITGDETWAIDIHPHPPDEFTKLSNNHYIAYNDKLYQLELCITPDRMMFVNVHEGKATHDDSVIYTLDEIPDLRHRYKLGHSKLDRIIWDLYDKNRFTYVYNDIGDVVARYVSQCKRTSRY